MSFAPNFKSKSLLKDEDLTEQAKNHEEHKGPELIKNPSLSILSSDEESGTSELKNIEIDLPH